MKAEEFGGFAHVAANAGDGLGDVFDLEMVGGGRQGLVEGQGRGLLAAGGKDEGQVFGFDAVALRKKGQPFHQVSQFPHIAGPTVGNQPTTGFG